VSRTLAFRVERPDAPGASRRSAKKLANRQSVQSIGLRDPALITVDGLAGVNVSGNPNTLARRRHLPMVEADGGPLLFKQLT